MIDGGNAVVLAAAAFAVAASSARARSGLAPIRVPHPRDSNEIGAVRWRRRRHVRDHRHPGHRNSPASRTFRRSAAWAVVGASAVWLLGVVFAGVVVTAAWAAHTAHPITAARRTRRQVSAAVPDAAELLVLFIRAGLTPHQAVRAMRSHAPRPVVVGFEAVCDRLDRGVPLADALPSLVERLGPELAGVADTLAISVRHGTPIAGALEQLSAEVRLRRQRLAEADAQRLPVRLSFPLVFCTLPSFVLVAIAPAVLAALSSIGDTPW